MVRTQKEGQLFAMGYRDGYTKRVMLKGLKVEQVYRTGYRAGIVARLKESGL